MKRRNFLQSVAGLILWHPATARPIITAFGDCFLIEVGCLHCAVERCPGGSTLTFNVYVEDHPIPGMFRVRRMVPSVTLKRKLERVGFPSVLEGDEQYPSLVARIRHFPRPNEVGERLQQILRGCDCRLLCHDPDLAD